MITVRVGGLSFTSDPASGWGLSNLQGWESGAPVKTRVRERSQADGAHGLARFFRSARVITMNGLLTGSTPAENKAMRRAVAALQANGVPSLFEVEEDGETLSAVVNLIGTPDVDERPTDVLTRYVLQFEAPDHRKYAASVTVSVGLPSSGGGAVFPVVFPVSFGVPGVAGRVVTVNPGVEETYSVLEVTGGLSGGFELSEVQTGRVLRFEREIPVGSTVVLNPRTGRAFIDVPGNDVTAFLTRREWWSVPAGGTREVQFNSIGTVTGTPTLVAKTSPAY